MAGRSAQREGCTIALIDQLGSRQRDIPGGGHRLKGRFGNRHTTIEAVASQLGHDRIGAICPHPATGPYTGRGVALHTQLVTGSVGRFKEGEIISVVHRQRRLVANR